MPKFIPLLSKCRDRCDVWNAELLHGCKYDGDYDMPVLPICDIVPQSLIAFTKARAKSKNADGSFVHCYEDDYKFECLWRQSKRYLPLMKSYGGAIAPDFSVYREMPIAQQIFNVFRSRAMGYGWTRNGIHVIPNVRWGDERTHKFCFDGLPTNSVLAVGTHGCVKHIDDRHYFIDGFMAMLERLCPKAIVVYGSASDKIFPPLFACNVEIIRFESDFSRSRKKGMV